MFVKNKEKLDFKYRKNGYLALLKANTVSYVDETKVTAKELKACYGQRIDIISREVIEDDEKEVGETQMVTPEKTEATTKIETVRKEELNNSFIEKVLGEIEGEGAPEGTKEPDEAEVLDDSLIEKVLAGIEDQPEVKTEVKTEEDQPEVKTEEDQPEVKTEEDQPEVKTEEAPKTKKTRATKAKATKTKAKSSGRTKKN